MQQRPIGDLLDSLRRLGADADSEKIDAGARVYISSRKADACARVAEELLAVLPDAPAGVLDQQPREAQVLRAGEQVSLEDAVAGRRDDRVLEQAAILNRATRRLAGAGTSELDAQPREAARQQLGDRFDANGHGQQR